jgi:hypothetical protein
MHEGNKHLSNHFYSFSHAQISYFAYKTAHRGVLRRIEGPQFVHFLHRLFLKRAHHQIEKS